MNKITDKKTIIAENVKKYIKLSDDEESFRAIVNLYRKYYSLVEPKKDLKDLLVQYENQIYEIDGKVMSEKDRIKLEINKISKKIEEMEEGIKKNDLTNEINTYKAISEYNDDVFSGYIDYIKDNLVYMQAGLGLKITFYTSAIDIFEKIYANKIKAFSENPDKKVRK